MSQKMGDEEIATMVGRMREPYEEADDGPCMKAFRREDQNLRAAFVRILTASSSAGTLPEWNEFDIALAAFMVRARVRHLSKHHAVIEAERRPTPVKVPVTR